MSDVEKDLVSYISASQEARRVLGELRGISLAGSDIQSALCEIYGISESNAVDLLTKNLSSQKIIDLLLSFDFGKYHPEIIAEVVLVESILPADHFRLLTEKTVKIKGDVWRIHKNDADPFPSVPHAHNYESGVVLHLGSGDYFDSSNRKYKGNVGCKALLRLRAELSKITLPSTECT